jgi:hypothetical protein
MTRPAETPAAKREAALAELKHLRDPQCRSVAAISERREFLRSAPARLVRFARFLESSGDSFDISIARLENDHWSVDKHRRQVHWPPASLDWRLGCWRTKELSGSKACFVTHDRSCLSATTQSLLDVTIRS